jgi:hypothetical protein
MTFDLPPPGAIEFTSSHGGTLKMTCGQQMALPVTVEYAPSVKSGVAGIVRRLEY